MARLKYETARFEASYGTVAQLPEPTTPEVSFVGRSNVGKSSLLNKLIGRKQLAKVSSQPGKTANINFFDVDGVRFVDLPGYGFAKVSRSEKQRWADLIGGYFEQERSFNLVVALVDIRHDAQKLDQEMLAFLIEALMGVSENDLSKDYEVTYYSGSKRKRNGESGWYFGPMVRYLRTFAPGKTIQEQVTAWATTGENSLSLEEVEELKALLLE